MSRPSKFMRSLVVAALLLVTNVNAGDLLLSVQPTAGKLRFFAIAEPTSLKINGTSEGPKGMLRVSGRNVDGTLDLDLSKLDSGIKIRNDHMKRKLLEVEKFPNAKLTLKNLELPNSVDQGGNHKGLPFKAVLSLHGVEKEVTGTCEIEISPGGSKGDGGKSVPFSAQMEILLSDFSMKQPSFMGVTVQDKVQIEVHGRAETP